VAIAKGINDRWPAIVLLIAAVACSSALRAQEFADDDAVVGEDCPPIAIRRFLAALVAAPARTQLDELLWKKIQYVDGICGLTDDQKKKLQMAGNGDIKHLLDRIEDLRKKLQSVQITQLDNLVRENESLKSLLNAGPLEKLSLFGKIGRRLLTAEQLAKLEADGILFSSAWMTDIDEARDLSRKHNRPLLVHFHADETAPCCQMKVVLYLPKVIRFLHDRTIPVFIDVGNDDGKKVMRQFGINFVPSDLIINPDGVVVDRSQGTKSEQGVMEMLQSATGAALQSTQ
jgi:hypothetical protein